MKYKLLRGLHSIKGKIYYPGDEIECKICLDKEFPEKFEAIHPHIENTDDESKDDESKDDESKDDESKDEPVVKKRRGRKPKNK